MLGDSCPLIISSMEATADVIGRRDPRLSDIRDEIDRRRRHCDAAAWLTRQLGSSAYVTVAGEPTSWPPPPPSRRQSMRDVDIVARCKNCDTPTPTEADMLAHRCPDAAT